MKEEKRRGTEGSLGLRVYKRLPQVAAALKTRAVNQKAKRLAEQQEADSKEKQVKKVHIHQDLGNDMGMMPEKFARTNLARAEIVVMKDLTQLSFEPSEKRLKLSVMHAAGLGLKIVSPVFISKQPSNLAEVQALVGESLQFKPFCLFCKKTLVYAKAAFQTACKDEFVVLQRMLADPKSKCLLVCDEVRWNNNKNKYPTPKCRRIVLDQDKDCWALFRSSYMLDRLRSPDGTFQKVF